MGFDFRALGEQVFANRLLGAEQVQKVVKSCVLVHGRRVKSRLALAIPLSRTRSARGTNRLSRDRLGADMKLLAISAALAFLTLSGCSSGGYETPSMDEHGRYVIHMTAGSKFLPLTAHVPLNATVVWINDGGIHDVTADDGSWSSDNPAPEGLGRKMSAGDEYARTFPKGGTFNYHCDIHHGTMKGILTVG